MGQHGELSDLSEEALSVFFALFMDVFTNPELQQRFSQQPALARDLGMLMIYELGGQHTFALDEPSWIEDPTPVIAQRLAFCANSCYAVAPALV